MVENPRGRKLKPRIRIPREDLANYCQRQGIRSLALFGSVLRADFGPHSHVDVLVEFEPGVRVGLFELYDMEQELSRLLGGRKVDMNTAGSLSKYFRDQILHEAEEQYVQA
jgi:predicted nucleotidyltransferase